MVTNVKWIIKEWKKHPLFIVLLVGLTLLSSFVTVAYPYAIKQLIDRLYSELANPLHEMGVSPEIQRIVWVLLAIGLIKLVASIYPGLRAFMNLTFEYTLRNRYFGYILKKDHKFFNAFKTGDLITRLTSDITDYPKIAWFMCSAIFRALESSSKILFSLAAMLLLNWKLALVTIAPLPVMMTIFYFISYKFSDSFQANQEVVSDMNNQLEMSFSGVRVIKSFSCENNYNRVFAKLLKNRYQTEMRVVKLNTRIKLVYEYINYFGQIMVITFGGIMVVNQEITAGTFLAFYTYLSLIVYPILDIPQLFVTGKQAFVNIDRLEEIRNYPVQTDKGVNATKIERVESIAFENVSFAYKLGAENVLNNVSFKIERGERIVIIGGIGSGKSTILGLLTGLLKPQSGTIKINDIPLKNIDLVSLREKIGYVPQEPILFSGSIKENVIFGKENVADEYYRDVLGIVQMNEEIDKFGDKDNTHVGEKGHTLSGGQKQRLAIARALLKDPEILIFDDITASLDADNEESLWEEISSNFKDITCFIVSHRLSTLKYIDNVIFLDKGHIIAKGEHSEVMYSSPEYNSFIKTQLHTKE